MSEQKINKTVLGADCKLTGELQLDSDAVVLGQFKGTLRVNGVLEIGETAHVTGGIIAGAIRIAGQVDAEVLRVGGVCDVTSTGKITGTMIVGTLRLGGNAEANVVAEQGVELIAGSRLTGQLFTSSLSIVDGATFQGDVCVGPKAIQAAGSLLRQAQASESVDAAETSAPPEGDGQSVAPPAEEAVWADNAAEPSPTVQVGSSALNAILQRRRAKVIPAGKPDNGNGRH